MQVEIHVDDVGLYDADLLSLADLHRSGHLQSVSIVANGRALESAASLVRKHPTLGCSVHLNLLEGPALSSRKTVQLLVNRHGEFRHSFLSLWSYHLSEAERRANLAAQIGREMAAQINLVRESCGREQVTVDSHRYVHLLPFVWPFLVEHSTELGITGIRTVNEPWVRPQRLSTAGANLLALNPAKRPLLNRLSAGIVPILDEWSLSHSDFSVGVACSGRMDARCVERALQRIAGISETTDPRIVLVFHPLRAREPETGAADRNAGYWRFYTSAAREEELRTLCSSVFRSMLSAYRAAPAAGPVAQPGAEIGARARRDAR